jgi:hypothetical protein
MQEYKLRPIKFLWQLLNRTISEAKVYILGYRSYTALISQSSINPPVATVLENTIGDIWFTYGGIGDFRINSNNLFTLDKTVVFFGPLNTSNTSGAVLFYEPVINIIVINLLDFSGNNTNNIGDKLSIEIRVYN